MYVKKDCFCLECPVTIIFVWLLFTFVWIPIKSFPMNYWYLHVLITPRYGYPNKWIGSGINGFPRSRSLIKQNPVFVSVKPLRIRAVPATCETTPSCPIDHYSYIINIKGTPYHWELLNIWNSLTGKLSRMIIKIVLTEDLSGGVCRSNNTTMMHDVMKYKVLSL